MAYYFAVEVEKENYVGKDIKKSGYFGENYTYQKYCECSLEEINRYTIHFLDEQRLKNCLFSEGILNEEDMVKPLAIIYCEGVVQRLVKGNILYKDSQKLIENPLEVLKYIDTRVQENDYTFFRNLVSTLPEDSISRSRVTKLAFVLEQRAVTNSEEEELTQVNIIGNKMVTVREIAELLIYNTYIDEEGTIKCTQELNYENFHNLVSSISDYEHSLNKEKVATLVRAPQKNTSV